MAKSDDEKLKLASIDLPTLFDLIAILCDVATQQGTEAIAELERQKIAALALLPAA